MVMQLDGGDIHERGAQLGVGQVGVRQDVRVEGLVFPEILALEAL